MYKHPMLSVKEAAAALGCDERWIREKLNQGQLKGEKRTIGMKDKWFVYKGEIDAAIARKGPHAPLDQSMESSQTNFAPQTEKPIATNNASASMQNSVPTGISGPAETWRSSELQSVDDYSAADKELDEAEMEIEARRMELIAEKLIKPLTEQLNLRDKELQQASYRLGYLEGKMEDQQEQIKLLPDYQARAEEAERLRVEAEQAKMRAGELEKLNEIRELEIEALKTQIAALTVEQSSKVEEERQAADQAKRQAEQLAEEIALLKSQKDNETARISELTGKLQEMQTPWWKKLFSPGEQK